MPQEAGPDYQRGPPSAGVVLQLKPMGAGAICRVKTRRILNIPWGINPTYHQTLNLGFCFTR